MRMVRSHDAAHPQVVPLLPLPSPMSHSAAATLEPSPTPAPRGLYLVVPKDPPFRPIWRGFMPPDLPVVQREEPEEDSVPPNATDREILVRTANQVGSLYHRFPVVEGEVKEVKDRVRGLGREVRDLHGVVENVRERVEVLETNPPGATQTDTLSLAPHLRGTTSPSRQATTLPRKRRPSAPSASATRCGSSSRRRPWRGGSPRPRQTRPKS